MKKSEERNYLIDNLKVFLVLLVVLGHVIEYYINSSKFLMGIYIFIYIFHMPLFVFISGYLSKNVDKCSKGSIKSLLIPYLFFNTLWYIIASIWSGEIIFSIFNPGWTLWYLISLFTWRLTIKYLIRIKYIVAISIFAALLISIIPNSESVGFMSRTVAFLPFFLIGHFTKEENIKYIKSIKKEFSFILIGIFAVISYYVTINNLVDYKFLYNSQSYYDTGLSSLNGIMFRVVLYIGSIILGICIINITPKEKLFFSYIGKKTMNIYVFHIYLVLLVYAIVPKGNMSIMQNIVLLISPFLIIYLLSRKLASILYNKIFTPIKKESYKRAS